MTLDDSHAVCILKNWLYLPAFFMALGLPEQMAFSITALTILMLVDFVTGVMASIRVDGVRSVTSRRMIAGAMSKMLVLLIPFVLAVAAKGIGIDMEQYVQGTLYVLILAEAYSNLGNIQTARTGQRVAEVDAVSFVLKAVRNKVSDMLNATK